MHDAGNTIYPTMQCSQPLIKNVIKTSFLRLPKGSSLKLHKNVLKM